MVACRLTSPRPLRLQLSTLRTPHVSGLGGVAETHRDEQDSAAFERFQQKLALTKSRVDVVSFLRDEPGVTKLERDVSGRVQLVKTNAVIPAWMDMNKSNQDRMKEERDEAERNENIQEFLKAMRERYPTAMQLKNIDESHIAEWKRWRLAKFTDSMRFQGFFGLLIVINAIVVGIQSDIGDGKAGWTVLETLFLLLFCIELGLKIFAFRLTFFSDTWNVVDTVIVACSVVEIMIVWGDGEGSSGISSLRLFRIFRILRLVRFLPGLRRIVEAFWQAMRSVLWVGLLLAIAMYIGAILAHNFFGNNPESEASQESFGTLPRSFATMFQVLTLDGWASEVLIPLAKTCPEAWAFFVPFVLFISFGLLNLLTGVFIEALMSITQRDHEQHLAEQERRLSDLLELVSEAFVECDKDGGNLLDLVEMLGPGGVYGLPAPGSFLGKCLSYEDMLQEVGLDYASMEKACKIAAYDLHKRRYISPAAASSGASDRCSEKGMQRVYHQDLSPLPPQFEREQEELRRPQVAADREGVMKEELLRCLVMMREPTTLGEHYEVMQRLSSLESNQKDMAAMIKRVLALLGEAVPLSSSNITTSNQDPATHMPGHPPAQSDLGADAVNEKETNLLIERYDLEGSGVIDHDTLKQLVVNMCYRKHLSCNMDALDVTIDQTPDLAVSGFREWFEANSSRFCS